MKSGVFQSTLREMQHEFRKPIVWVVLIGIGIVLAFAGAFGTSGVLRPFPLAIYWIGTVCLTYAAGSYVSTFCRYLWEHWNKWLRIGVSGLIVGVAICLVIFSLNTLVFGPIYHSISDVVSFAAMVLVVTSVINLILNLAFEAAAPSAPIPISAPAILSRMPLEHRGALVSISVEDHYVRIRTENGEAMVLMRLSDAINETDPTPGIQVHRSHWVATSAIKAAVRKGNSAILTLSHGPDIPVSRSKLPLLKDAQLL